MEIVKKPISEIRPYPNNPRINDDAVDAVVESIRQCGYCAPIVVDENMVILAGHTRLKALQKLCWEEAEVCIKAGLSEEQKRKYRILDNKTAELAAWDEDLLVQELEGLDFGPLVLDWDIEDVGAVELGSEELAEDDDYEIDLPAEPRAKLGDIYQLGRHRLMCGDSTSAEAVHRLAAGGSVRLLLTDPPYGVNYSGGTKDALTIENDDLNDEEFLEFLCAAFTAADESMMPGAAFYIWHADSRSSVFRQACELAGWTVRQCLVWVKNSLVLGRQDYQWKHEPCLYGWKAGAAHKWRSDRKQTTILEFDRPQRNAEHPTMKPVPLFDYQIRNNTDPGDIVLDLFAGSGTTLIASEQNGRTAYCMEYDPHYVDVIIDRWQSLTGKEAVLVERFCPE